MPQGKKRVTQSAFGTYCYKSSKSIIRHYSRKMERRKAEKWERLPKLHPEDISLIKEIRFLSDQPCGKGLHAMPATWLDFLSKRRKMEEEVASRILRVSSTTLNRVHGKFKTNESQKHNRQTLSALKQSIPIIDTTRDIDKLRHFADTVEHCGESVRGSFVWTLTVTDDLTLRTDNRAVWNKGRKATSAAFLHLLREMPFMIRGINTDNGSEFINYHLQTLLKEKSKRFKLSRSRPHKRMLPCSCMRLFRRRMGRFKAWFQMFPHIGNSSGKRACMLRVQPYTGRERRL